MLLVRIERELEVLLSNRTSFKLSLFKSEIETREGKKVRGLVLILEKEPEGEPSKVTKAFKLESTTAKSELESLFKSPVVIEEGETLLRMMEEVEKETFWLEVTGVVQFK